MEFTQVRHGTHIINYKGKKILVDPVFAEKETMGKLPRGRINSKNPMTKLPFQLNYFNDIDCILLTHIHFDHFDKSAQQYLNKSLQVICSEKNKKVIKKWGFQNAISVKESIVIENIQISIVEGGKHGIGLEGKLMGDVYGYIIKDLENIEPTIYIIGDSIWCNVVEENIKDVDVIIAFGGEARLPFGKNITMNEYDIEKVVLKSNAKIIVNHMDTWNHCFMTKEKLKNFIINKSYKHKILIPDDGEKISI